MADTIQKPIPSRHRSQDFARLNFNLAITDRHDSIILRRLPDIKRQDSVLGNATAHEPPSSSQHGTVLYQVIHVIVKLL